MICARLLDGSIVELEQDCDCITHTGPHWLHDDRLCEERNQQRARELVEDAQMRVVAGTARRFEMEMLKIALAAISVEEVKRIDRALKMFALCGIEEILYDLP